MYLYKVTPLRDSLIFYPSVFYRTDDFMSSATKPQPGYVEDKLLYAGEFHDISIHLLPLETYRIQIQKHLDNYAKLSVLGFKFNSNRKSVIFININDYQKIIEFQPTVYTFDKKFFLKTPSSEYVANVPVEAIKYETYTMPHALDKWNVELITVPSVIELHDKLIESKVSFVAQD
ncbi:MAG: hypothetical protein A2504_00590 [Bdellovibrionales bacterium RIFOXYD12_FULL_39_22]|nr:MAG: hypothetical protein A2385_03210 [Bdellovibrionales bacterium RIFOXYB1_FULL_39_21]OFZ75317.1 MAG: hypothetical protein A2560_13975 [Bdellovibrionales bacterium RIFOXYD1_FULL_39_84]OFZ93268.1 MAG: hypothetical protein A2504_00590 [Bdellovibrionales bacterium RIFOXYD12_FULL_39_22]